LIEYAVKIALGMYIEKIKKPDVPRQYINGQYFLSDHSGILAEVDIEEKIHKKNYLEEMHFYKQIGDPVLVPPEGYEYLGWITVSGENFLDAQDNLKEAMQYITYTVVKFDADSSIGKTSRKNRFSAAVLNKNLLLQAAKIESIRRISKRNLRNLHIGIAYNSKEQTNGNGKSHIDFPYAGETIEKSLRERGYKVSLFDFNNLSKVMGDLQSTEVDLVFNVSEKINNSHGLKPHVAAILEGLQIPYTGSNAFTLNMCMDKIAVKKLLTYHNIPTPKWDYMYELNDDLRDDLKFPLIVKPAASDNSLGITNQSVVTNKKDLHRQIKRIIEKMRQPIIVEEYIDGDEYDVSILGNNERDLQVLPLTRSIFKNMPSGYWHIYTYEAKWLKHPAYQQIILQRPPKNINRKLEALITEIALDAYSIFDCRDYGRVEVRIDKDNNPYVLELNPNPSLASNMDIPEVAKFINMDYGNLIEEIIYMAVNRYKNQSLFEQISTVF
ncbi:MAG: ATP-grasp domain-containing protein, partial [Patescibacteria group bacterium]|nr:ATP-grasp domain-containing protein [Patescibacteria group bacterium]